MWIAIVASLLLGTACSSADNADLDVFAASSLTNAFGELAEQYEARTGVSVRLNFAGSSTLREQIRDGADADVFASANAATMDALIASGAIEGPASVFAVNRLVLAVPAGNPAGIVGLADLERSDLFVGLCARGVPCGDLADASLAAAGIDAAVDTFEPNVSALANRVADGELDAGLVYASDVVAAGGGLDVIVSAVGEPARYPIAAVSSDSPEAQAFVGFVRSDVGLAILDTWGFAAP